MPKRFRSSHRCSYLLPVALVASITTVLGGKLSFASAWTPKIPPLPSTVDLKDATISYPETLMNKLFSSVPKRQYAVDHISISFSGGSNDTSTSRIPSNENTKGRLDLPTILVGRSASGKSALFRLISGDDKPTSGTININQISFSDGDSTQATPRPIIIDRRPSFDDSATVMDRLVATVSDTPEKDLVTTLATDFATTLGLTSEQLQSNPSSLSPSGQFLFGIACGCVSSVSPALPPTLSDAIHDGIQYPILLLDELFDFEHPDVPKRCCSGIEELVRLGAVVIIATHKSHHWESLGRRRVVALSSGRILSQEIADKGKAVSMQFK